METVCRRAFARENGYVIVEAMALLIAARRNITAGGGVSLFERGSRRRLSVS